MPPAGDHGLVKSHPSCADVPPRRPVRPDTGNRHRARRRRAFGLGDLRRRDVVGLCGMALVLVTVYLSVFEVIDIGPSCSASYDGKVSGGPGFVNHMPKDEWVAACRSHRKGIRIPPWEDR